MTPDARDKKPGAPRPTPTIAASLIGVSLPTFLIGVFLMFFYTGASFTREAYIGVIMMGGIVVNNAIVLVDCINRRRVEYPTLREAILQAARERLRPILMTTATTILGLMPLLLARGIGSEVQRPLASVVVGGLITSTLLTLILLPVIYEWAETCGEKSS